MNLQLEKATVELKEKITYGDKCDIEAVLLKGVKGVQGEFDTSVMWNAKIQTLKTYIVSITEDGKNIPFTEDWLRGLSVEDGEKLVDTVNGLNEKKKKS